MTDATEAYKEICANIRESDNISFKLIALVPIASTLVVASLTFAQRLNRLDEFGSVFPALVFLLLSLGGGLIVFGIYMWERRNVQKCDSLIESAKDLETENGNLGKQYRDWVARKQTRGFGKTQAETLIYTVALVLWLIPAAVALMTLCRAMNTAAA